MNRGRRAACVANSSKSERVLRRIGQFLPAATAASLGYLLGGAGIAVIFGVASLIVVALARIPLAPIGESRVVRLIRRAQREE